MTAAIFGLIGVVIGSLITGGTNYVLQVRAERREIRAAARLTLQELSNTAFALRFALDRNDRLVLESAAHAEQWNRHGLLLARHLSDQEWDAVALGYGEGGTAELLDGQDEWRADAEAILIHVDEACKILRGRLTARGGRGKFSSPLDVA